MANDIGLLVILRAGPYICAEWDMVMYISRDRALGQILCFILYNAAIQHSAFFYYQHIFYDLNQYKSGLWNVDSW